MIVLDASVVVELLTNGALAEVGHDRVSFDDFCAFRRDKRLCLHRGDCGNAM